MWIQMLTYKDMSTQDMDKKHFPRRCQIHRNMSGNWGEQGRAVGTRLGARSSNILFQELYEIVEKCFLNKYNLKLSLFYRGHHDMNRYS